MTAIDALHPPSETIAMIAEGKLPRRELAPLMEHIAGCAECRTELDLVSEALHDETATTTTSTSSRKRWLATAAAVAAVIVLAVLAPILRRMSVTSLESLAALAPRSARIVEPRLSGGFAWAPYTGALRGSDAAVDAQRLKLGGAAGDAIDAAQRDTSPSKQHTAGVALLLIEQPEAAIDRLHAAADKSPGDASIWSDLAAAQYSASLKQQRPSLLAPALASADRAISLDPHHAEALFNRALVLERLGLMQQARDAWQRYLAIDHSTAWAAEARKHLEALPVSSSDLLFRRTLPSLERAAAANDVNALAPVVRRWREQSRAWGEAEYLGRWGEAAQRGDASAATNALAIARSLGTELRKQSGESLLDDAVTAIDHGDATARALLAEAHATYRRGRIAYSRQLPTAAEPDLRRAADLFARAGSPMALMAKYYAANARFDANDPAGSRAELETLLPAPRNYIAASALIQWQLSRCHTFDGDVAGALPLLLASANSLRRLDERSNLGFVDALLADTYFGLGRPVDAWTARVRSFEVLSRDGRSDRLLANVASAMTAEMRAGNRDAALALLAIEREIGRTIDEAMIRSNTLARGAVLRAELGDVAGATVLADEAAATVATIADPEVRALADANARFARGAVQLHTNPTVAMQRLGEALAAYQRMRQPAREIDCRLLLARGAQALGRLDDAAHEIDAGLAALDQFRVRLDGVGIARGVFDAGDELRSAAIRVSLDRGDAARAFRYAETARTQSGRGDGGNIDVSPQAIASRLAGSDAAVLELAVLADESVTFFLDARGLAVARRRVSRDEVRTLAQRVATGDRAASTKLFELFIRPWAVTQARSLIVVADAPLDGVPFAALYDEKARQHLVERVCVLEAESAASLRAAKPRDHAARVVTLSLPSGAAAGSAPLDDSTAEVTEVAGAYSNAVRLSSRATFGEFVAAARGADVVHVSGHTRDDGDGGTAALDFARNDDGDATERVPWRTVAAAPLHDVPLVVLAACDSLRLPQLSASRAPSLGGAFLAAGAAEVIGTLRPITDRDARDLFPAIHRAIAAGASPGDAVRDVQRAAIASRTANAGAWESLAVLTREIPRSRERSRQ